MPEITPARLAEIAWLRAEDWPADAHDLRLLSPPTFARMVTPDQVADLLDTIDELLAALTAQQARDAEIGAIVGHLRTYLKMLPPYRDRDAAEQRVLEQWYEDLADAVLAADWPLAQDKES